MEKIRLSHSALKTFLTCERKFQLERLLEGADKEDSTNPNLVFGKAFGVFVSSYFLTQNTEESLFKAWLEYFPIEEDSIKTESSMIIACLAAIPTIEALIQDYEVATFNFKPAVELSFRLDIDDNCYFIGYVDLVLRNRHTGRMAILEVKTTKLAIHDLSLVYGNSGQALGYSITLDQIVGEEQAEYDVIYLVSQLNPKTFGSVKTQLLHFNKTIADRFNWFIALSMDVQRLGAMIEAGVFPLRGESCLQYNRPCPHFGTCNLHALDRVKEIPIDEVDYQFKFNLDDVINSHIRRIKND